MTTDTQATPKMNLKVVKGEASVWVTEEEEEEEAACTEAASNFFLLLRFDGVEKVNPSISLDFTSTPSFNSAALPAPCNT